MTSVNTTRPPAMASHAAPAPAPMHVPLENDGGIESIVLELEDQSRRSRELRNDARDAGRDQQAIGIKEARKSATLALVGSLVKTAAETAASIGSAARSGQSETPSTGATGAPAGGAPVATAAANTPPGAGTQPESGSGAGVEVGVGVGKMTSAVFDHFAARATTRGEVAGHAADAYGDVADDAAQAEQDAQRMSDRALQHLDAIQTARREAEAAILRG
ncbi:MAG: hypothetical protein IPL19_23535 [Sandaracinaceae bacterium]|jgi:hypothetical protein|nr:hypothetical protein [Sandaracinaceae bacterium]MBK7152141.1 hypothetical protein [Sandaracinaceae bacterium]MBK8410921.1 hypothetical protein [Sandaracinaceae bacterium]MBK8587841.1 hypothetical protein [Sandaracinaceae bacterium]